MDGDRSGLPHFLFLQGLASPFQRRLGVALAERGHSVRKIVFNGGDRLFWRLPGAVDYRGDLGGWPDFLEARLRDWGITDIVIFGDCRPLHQAAIRAASRRGISVYVAEEGYLRPNWITLAPSGVNGNSSLPRDPAWFRREALLLPSWRDAAPVGSRFWRRAVYDVAYHVARLSFRWRYPGYRTHLAWNPFVEYAGWLGKFARAPWRRRRADADLRVLSRWKTSRSCFFFPLQLESDSQIRFHVPYDGLASALDRVMESFARFAPPDAALIVKEHPLDPGLGNWRRATHRAASRFGVADRVLYIEGGRADAMLQGCRGVVTLNSTVGILALSAGVPTIALGSAIYDMPGLTFQHGLDRFWMHAAPPDAALFDAFRRVVAHRTQVNGGFFSKEGVTLAVVGAVARLESAGSPELSVMSARRNVARRAAVELPLAL